MAPLSAFEAADLKLYKDGSNVERTSANGITMTSPFDGIVGLHDVAIDLSDNSDSGFYAAGSFYAVVLSPDTETVDSQTIVKVLAYFEIGVPVANVTQFGGSAGTFASGRPEVNTTHVAGTTQTAGDIIADTNDIQARLPGALTGAGNIKADAQVVSDKTNYSLAQTFPSNFASMLIDSSGRVTVGAIVNGAIAAATFAANALDAVWSTTIRLLTAGTNIVLAKNTGVTGFTDIDAAGVRLAVGLATANLDTQLDALPTAAEITADMDANSTRLSSIDGKTSALPSDPADASDIAAAFGVVNAGLATIDSDVLAVGTSVLTRAEPGDAMTLTAGERADLANALLDLADSVESGLTLRGSIRLMAASLAGKLAGAPGTTIAIRNAVADSKVRITATVDANGNRTALSTDTA